MPQIDFNYLADFKIDIESAYKVWIDRLIISEDKMLGEISYIFCTDDYLLDLHKEYLGKDDLTDIITFDYSEGSTLSGDVFISVERVSENASKFEVDFEEELLRVMAHGVLHLAGYTDKSPKEQKEMRSKEEEKIRLFHVEQ